MELEPTSTPFEPPDDKRPRLYEPPPVKLVAVADCVLQSSAGLESELDDFYIGLLGFEREDSDTGLVYRAENFRLRFEIVESRGPRDDFRALGVIVPSLPVLVQRLNDVEMEFTRQRWLAPGKDSILLPDPAGNLVEVVEERRIL